MDYNFTAQDVLDKVIEIGNRFPDYSYMSPNDGLGTFCQYTDGADGQGCIVGQALRALGVPYDVLVVYDRGGIPASLVVEKILGSVIDMDITDRLNNIQAAQDSGYPWGQCVR